MYPAALLNGKLRTLMSGQRESVCLICLFVFLCARLRGLPGLSQAPMLSVCLSFCLYAW